VVLTTHITIVPLVLGPCLLRPQFILVDLAHRPIMPILPAGFQFLQGPQVPTALLMHTLGSRVGMVPRAIEKLVGNAVSGSEVGIQVDGMLGQHTTMARLRLLGL
jgi:hypothetical protein